MSIFHNSPLLRVTGLFKLVALKNKEYSGHAFILGKTELCAAAEVFKVAARTPACYLDDK